MRVLHFGRFFNDAFGGIERHVHLLLRELSASIQVDNLVANDTPEMTILETDGFRVYKSPSHGVLAGVAISPAMISMARTLHRQNNYDIIHLHLPDPLSHLAALALPHGPKIVVTWHSDIIRQRRALKLYQPLMNRFLKKHVSAVIAATPNHFLSSNQLAALEKNRRHVIPYGLDFSCFDTACAMKKAQLIRQNHPGKFIVFAVGRHVYYKGFSILIEAMRSIENAVLIMGGSGPLTPELKNQVNSLQLQDKIIFTGRIPEEDLPAYYQAADIFCMPSTENSEAFGIVQLEAMACGKPVICCELNTGVTFVNRHMQTGLAAPPHDGLALTHAIQTLQASPELRAKLGANARERARSEFSAQRMSTMTLDLYQTLLKPC